MKNLERIALAFSNNETMPADQPRLKSLLDNQNLEKIALAFSNNETMPKPKQISKEPTKAPWIKDKPQKNKKKLKQLKSKYKLEIKQILLKFKVIVSPHNFGEKCLLFILAELKKKKRRMNPILSLSNALEILKPGLKLISQVKSGKIVYLPAYVREEAAYYLAIRWIYNAAHERNKKVSIFINLSLEICETLDNRGSCLKAKFDLVKAVRGARANIRKPYIKKHWYHRGLRRRKFSLLKWYNGKFIKIRKNFREKRRKGQAKKKEIETIIKKAKIRISDIKLSDVTKELEEISNNRMSNRQPLTDMISKMIAVKENSEIGNRQISSKAETVVIKTTDILTHLKNKLTPKTKYTYKKKIKKPSFLTQMAGLKEKVETLKKEKNLK